MPTIEDVYRVCDLDIGMALDHMSFKNRDGSFKTFNTEAQFIRQEQLECSYCGRPALWRLIYKGI